MNIEKIEIGKIRPNPNNPRVIRDEKFKKLVKSLEDFPDMMSLRPIVVDENYEILGGNMRWKAAKAAGWKEVFILKVDLDDNKKKEFLIKDNINYGQWDYLLLKDYDALDEWGMDIPSWMNVPEEDEEDDFFGDDFYTPNQDTSEYEEKVRMDSITNTTYFLLNFELKDWEFIMKMEPTLLRLTGENNLSDALLKIITK